MSHSLRAVALRCFGLTTLAFAQHGVGAADRVIPNDNRVAAGRLRDGELTLHLEARDGTWFPDASDGPSVVMPMFAEAGKAPQNPGPLIRVPAGTRIRMSVHNALRDSVLTVYGLNTRPASITDTVQIAPGATRHLLFMAGAPGTYFYWGSTNHQSILDRNGSDSQLHGAFIVDEPGRAAANDRVFVLGSWSGPDDRKRLVGTELRVINGLSWPHTERFKYSVGDTVRWRWVNPSDSPHPMHLHGFYFDVNSRGTWAADTAFSLADAQHVVTEMPLPGGTYAMTWVPSEPGNWLMHCHVAFHTSFYLSAWPVRDPDDPIATDPMTDMATHMRGMVLGISVAPGHSTARRPEIVAGARDIRLIAQSASKRWRGELDEMAYVEQRGNVPPAADSVPSPSSLLVLRRGEPVRITVVNHTRAPTAVHWHGIELGSYADGVPGWSGMGSRVAPMIAPGDSFVAGFTPTRNGTFAYHSHSNETFQVNLGLYGALLVVDSATYDPARERIILVGGDGPGGKPGRINGRLKPDTLRMTVGETYRIRLIDMMPDWTIRVSLTREDSVVHWRALAKDGAELPTRAQMMQRAAFITGPGQTFDFEYKPTAEGLMVFQVQHRVDPWKTQLPIRVSR